MEYGMRKMAKKWAVSPVLEPFVKALEHIEAYTMEKPSPSFSEIDALLKDVLENSQTDDHAPLRVMTKIKQGQLSWIRNDMARALSQFPHLSSVRVDNAPIHSSKVLMEGSLYTGLATEVCYSAGGKAEKLAAAIIAYEECLRLALDLTVITKSSSLKVHPSVFRSIRTSLERGPMLCIRLGDPIRSLGFFRKVLMMREEHMIPQVRQICCVSLSAVLLFFVSPGSYQPFTYSQNAFSPTQLIEETLLTACLNKTYLGSLADTKPLDVSALFDIITLTYTDARLPAMLVHHLEDSMPFASKAPHVWLQFGLSLVNARHCHHAEAVFRECVRVFPGDVKVLVTAAGFAAESLGRPELCLEWCLSVKDSAREHYLEPRLYLLLGKAQAALAEKELTFEKKQAIHVKSLEYFEQAVELDPQEVEFVYHYALHLAIARQVTLAREKVQYALGLDNDDTLCLHLLALLLSAEKHLFEALQICELALQQDPENLGLLKTKIVLQVSVQGVHPALQTCKLALKTWQKLYSSDDSGLIGAVTQDARSLSDIPLRSVEHTDHPHHLGADIASDAGSSHFSSSYLPTLNAPTIAQAGLWCTVANVFMAGHKYSDAASCINEAQFLSPYLPIVSITHGKVLECEKQPNIALDVYNNALVLQPSNSFALTNIGRLLFTSGKTQEAEKYLREATSSDRLNHEAWFWLGRVFAAQGEHELAADCFKTSLQFESTAPVVPFTASCGKL